VLALGGFHPSNAERDQEVQLAAAIVALASLPSAVLFGERLLRRAPARQTLGAALHLLLPAAVAIWVLRFIGSVDLTPRLRSGDLTSAEAVERAITERLPPGASRRSERAMGWSAPA
jgi:hypothetical protein